MTETTEMTPEDRATRQVKESVERVEKKYVAFDPKTSNSPESPGRGEKQANYKPVDYKKRYDDLKRHYDVKVNEWKGKEKELAKAIPEYKPPKTKAELEEFKKKNPDLFGLVETIAHELSDSKIKSFEEQINFVKLEKAVKVREHAVEELRRLHPDMDQLRTSDDFHNWAKQQPKVIQDWLYVNTSDPNLAAKAVTMYKAERQKEHSKRVTTSNTSANAVRTRASADISSTSPKIWTTSEIAAMSISDYEVHKQELFNAQREGRILKR
jgi:hypothetical protein